MNEIQRYLAEEHVEDFRDGLITRRELLRRVTLITGSAAAAGVFLVACGVGGDGAGAPAPVAPTAAASPAGTPAPTAPLTDVVPYATPPASTTTDGVTVATDDPRIEAQDVEVPAADGAMLIGYISRPREAGTYPGILVIHENRGLLEHIKDVTRRFATAGFVAVSIDLLSRDGGAERLSDQGAYNAALGQRSTADMVRDLESTLAFLRDRPFVDVSRIGVTGYCFGGGMTWHLLNAGAEVQAAIPFYGPGPSEPSGIGSTRAAVLGVYAEQDERVNASMGAMEEQLRRAGTTYEIKVYPGVGHAFHNDTGTRYGAEQARQAWVDTVEWFRRHLA